MCESMTTYCETCNSSAPELGDQGMMGLPSLELVYKEHDWVEVSFGWI